jgi:Dynamin central region
MIKKHRPYKLPIFVNTDVFEQIVRESIENDWRDPCFNLNFNLVEATSKLLKNTMLGVLHDQLKLSLFPRLRDFLHFRIESVANEKIAECRDKVDDYIRREQVPYTQNHYLNEIVARLRYKILEGALFEALSLGTATDENDTLTKTSIKSVITGVIERNQKKSIDEHMGEDMQHALDAYGKVAITRFIDEVPMKCGKVLLDFPDAINQELNKISDVELEKCICVSNEDRTK